MFVAISVPIAHLEGESGESHSGNHNQSQHRESTAEAMPPQLGRVKMDPSLMASSSCHNAT